MIQKPPNIVSKKIRNSARGENCTLRMPTICNGNPETTVFAHINTKWKGTANKSPDLFGVYCCSDCHDWLDGRFPKSLDPNPAYRKHMEILRAMTETQMALYQKGLIEVH